MARSIRKTPAIIPKNATTIDLTSDDPDPLDDIFTRQSSKPSGLPSSSFSDNATEKEDTPSITRANASDFTKKGLKRKSDECELSYAYDDDSRSPGPRGQSFKRQKTPQATSMVSNLHALIWAPLVLTVL